MIQSKHIKYQSKQIKQAGFTLLELLMVIAVIGILATIAVPRLQNYSNKAKFTEVINAVGPYKSVVERCLSENPKTACDEGQKGIPNGFTTAQGRVASISIVDGKITATGVSSDFPVTTTGNDAQATTQGATYELTPTVGANSVTWAVGGTCTNEPSLCEGSSAVKTTSAVMLSN